MLAELGHFLLMLALMIALLQWIFAASSSAIAHRAPLLQLLTTGASFLILITAFVQSDFSVMNVAMNSHTEKPLIYKITGAWGNHEGSILLWICVLALFGYGLSRQPMDASFEPTRRQAIALQGGLQVGVLLFLLLTSNPFERVYPVPFEGKSLNPLLQDIGLAMHPPMLYLGYVGFAIVFCVSVAALLKGTVNRELATMLRPWILIPWALLTFGIGLGGWWAYRELGWGGWWFWDPVENASLLPWLAGTALLHSVIVLEKRGGLVLWVVLLSILTFSFSLMGTFLVRSGLITSVHSFASDPTRGVFILAYLGVVTGSALLVFARYAPRTNTQPFQPFTREGAIVANNLILIAAAASILLATTYPMMQELTGARPLTIGAPYYNKTVLPMLAPLIFLAGIGPLLAWNHTIRPRLRWLILAAFTGGIVGALILPGSLWAIIGTALSAWLAVSTLRYWKRLNNPKPRQYGMLVAHTGLALFTLAVTFSSLLKEEYEWHLTPGDSVEAGAYILQLKTLEMADVDNYTRLRGVVEVRDTSGNTRILHPELRQYHTGGSQTTEASVHTHIGGDIYAVLRKIQGNPEDALAVPDEGIMLNLFVNPMMPLLWFAIASIGFGGLLALLPGLPKNRRGDG